MERLHFDVYVPLLQRLEDIDYCHYDTDNSDSDTYDSNPVRNHNNTKSFPQNLPYSSAPLHMIVSQISKKQIYEQEKTEFFEKITTDNV